MNHLRYLMVICISGALTGKTPIQAQERDFPSESKIILSGISELYHLYDSLFDRQENLKDGKMFYPEGNKVHHPYFMNNEWNPGKIIFDGKSYEKEMLKYDIYSDYLICMFRSDSSAIPVKLNRESVREFVIGHHHFRQINYSQNDDLPKTGYFEILHEGRNCFYLRHEKNKSQNRFTLETEYPMKSTYYMKLSEKFSWIKNRHDFLNSFRDHKNDIRLYMKINNIRFSIQKYEQIIQVLEYFEKQYPL